MKNNVFEKELLKLIKNNPEKILEIIKQNPNFYGYKLLFNFYREDKEKFKSATISREIQLEYLIEEVIENIANNKKQNENVANILDIELEEFKLLN